MSVYSSGLYSDSFIETIIRLFTYTYGAFLSPYSVVYHAANFAPEVDTGVTDLVPEVWIVNSANLHKIVVVFLI